MRTAAVYCVYDDDDYLEVSLESVHPYLDRVLFLISDIPWNGVQSDNSSTIEKIEQLCSKNPSFSLHRGHWADEVIQRNFGLDILFREGVDYAFIIDADEIYHPHEFRKILHFIRVLPEIPAFHIHWDTYWKKDYYRIEPREAYRPLIAVRTDSFRFTSIRHGTTSIKRTNSGIVEIDAPYRGAIIPPEIALCYHLSYARTDENMLRKLETNSHAPEFVSGWYENVWQNWTPEMQNLHPITPPLFARAIKEDWSRLPESLKRYISEERTNR